MKNELLDQDIEERIKNARQEAPKEDRRKRSSWMNTLLIVLMAVAIILSLLRYF
ncbi:hypothetical protein [Streptococcus merionis]|uniref:hypothetical protein n=1 Tax=Streptococcus merionis TaxID=400065 RepID=UPI0026EE2F94|nr:hypothetical protein [Streptococcus merionis]